MSAVAAWLLDTSWQVALLVLGVLLVERVFGRVLAPRWRYALWLLVVARLALPFPLQAPGGLPSWDQLAGADLRPSPASVAREMTSPRDAPRTARPASDPARPRTRTGIEPLRHRRTEAAAAAPVAPTTPPPTELAPSERPAVGPRPTPRTSNSWRAAVPPPSSATATLDEPTSTSPAATAGADLPASLLTLWAVVAAALLARSAWHELRFRRALRHATPVTDARLRARLAEAAEALGVRRPVDVLRTDLVAAPAVHGIRHARLLLPPRMPAGFDDRAWGCVLRHELAHVAAHDVALGLAVTVLRKLFWFHPLVALAARRLSAAQEALRDWQAIAAAPGVHPGQHGRALLTLAEHTTLPAPTAITAGVLSRRSLEERIHMIARHRPSSPSHAVLGLALLLPLGWTGLITAPAADEPAEPEPLAATTASAGVTSDGRPAAPSRQVRVERHRPEPAWRAELSAALQRPVHLDVQDASIESVFDAIREQAGLNLVVRQDLLADWGDPPVTLTFESIAAGDLLDLVCRHVGDLDHTLARGVVYVGEEHDLPGTVELRFYTAPELFDTRWDDDDDTLELIREFGSDSESWDMQPQISLEVYDDLLVVSQTPENHERIEAFLERLLRGGETLPVATPAWRGELEAALAARTSIDHEGTLAEYAQILGSTHGLNILVDEEFHDDEVTLELRDVPLGLVLDWLAAFTGLSVVLDHGAVRLTEERAVTLRMHPVEDLLESWDQDDLYQLVEEHVDQESWFDDPRLRLTFWRDLLIVRQSEDAQAAIADLLDALRRAEAD